MEIKLHPHQIEHVNKLSSILDKSHCAVDLSPTGLGKTFAACGLGIQLDMPLFIICPAAARCLVWEETFKAYNVPYIDVISYEYLRSKNNIYLQKDEKEYKPTALLREITKEGILFIYDEAHKLKNLTGQNKAASCMNYTIKESNSSKLVFLSATLMDKPDQGLPFFKALGFVNYNSSLEDTFEVLVQEMRKFSVNADLPDLKVKVFNSIFPKVLKKISSTMKHKIDANLYIKNVFLKMSPKNIKSFLRVLRELNMMMSNNDKINIREITKCLIQIQLLKVNGMIKKAKEILLKSKSNKVILFCDYNIVMNKIINGLQEFEPLILSSKLKQSERVELVAKFQQNDNCHRLLISTICVAGTGISLHDIHGKFPRYVLLMPNFKVLDIQQAFGRIYRFGMKGDAHILILYGSQIFRKSKHRSFINIGELEHNIMTKLREKGEFMKEINREQVKSGIQFLCDVK